MHMPLFDFLFMLFFVCNCADHYFCELHGHVHFSNQIAMAMIADEIATVMGFSKNRFCLSNTECMTFVTGPWIFFSCL